MWESLDLVYVRPPISQPGSHAQAAGIPNSMVVALDDETATWLQQRQVDHYVKKLVSRTGDTGNHATLEQSCARRMHTS